MLKSLSTSLIARGILAVIIGIIALAWPSVTVLALVILFAVYAFIAAGLQAARGCSRTAGPVIGHLLLGLADLAAGVIALAWPGPTALVLVLIVGVWAVIAGLVEFSAAFRSGEPAGTRAILILGGLVTIAFGVVLVSRRMPAAAYASSRRTPRPRRGLPVRQGAGLLVQPVPAATQGRHRAARHGRSGQDAPAQGRCIPLPCALCGYRCDVRYSQFCT